MKNVKFLQLLSVETNIISVEMLVEDINLHENEENYQNKTISMLSKELTRKFGKGFSRANIWNMITFYKEYGSVQTVSERLSWSHYCELLSISDKAKRHFYEIECSKFQMERQRIKKANCVIAF